MTFTIYGTLAALTGCALGIVVAYALAWRPSSFTE